MRKAKWIFWGLVLLMVGLFLNYNMPQHDIVRITEASNRQTPLGAINQYFYASQDAGTSPTAVRDVRFIEAIYPNAVRITPVAGPDVRIIPWVNILILLLFAGAIFMVRRMWLQFWERMVDPAVASFEEAGDRTKGFFGRLFGRK